MKAPTQAQRLRGYDAADHIIEELTDSAQKDRPDGRINRNSKAYCAGYFAGLVAANAVMVLGRFPNIKSNAELIKRTIST